MNPNFLNLTKRKKRDLLFELLLGKSTEGIVSKKELIAVNKLIKGLSSSNDPNTALKRQVKTTGPAFASKKPAGPKQKTTFYLSQENSDNLDKARMTVRMLVPPDLRSRLSRSYIVNRALAVTLQDFKAKGKDSRLIRSIMQEI